MNSLGKVIEIDYKVEKFMRLMIEEIVDFDYKLKKKKSQYGYAKSLQDIKKTIKIQ